MDQVPEQAVLAKEALRLAEHTRHDSSGSDGVEVGHEVRDLEVLDASQRMPRVIDVQRKLTILRSVK